MCQPSKRHQAPVRVCGSTPERMTNTAHSDCLVAKWAANPKSHGNMKNLESFKAEPEAMATETSEAQRAESSPELRFTNFKRNSCAEPVLSDTVKLEIDHILVGDPTEEQLIEFMANCEALTEEQLDDVNQYTASLLDRIESSTEFDLTQMAIDLDDPLASLGSSFGTSPPQQYQPMMPSMFSSPVNVPYTGMHNGALTNLALEELVGQCQMGGMGGPSSLDSSSSFSSFVSPDFNANATFDATCGLKLKYHELWSRLHNLRNEMIVSTKGRQLFPPIEVTVPDLVPDQKYTAWLKFECKDPKGSGWRWTEQSGWQLVRKLRRTNSLLFHASNLSDHAQEFYAVPGGPFTGAHIMNEGLSFAHAKITNKPNTKGAVFIESFHQYVPVVYLAPVHDNGEAERSPTHPSKLTGHLSSILGPTVHCQPHEVKSYRLHLCEFIACTAYHNKELAQIKILANPQTRGTRVLGKITPDLAQEFVSGDLVGDTEIGKHKEQFLRRCASLGSVAISKADLDSGSESGVSDSHSMGPVVEGMEMNCAAFSPRPPRPLSLNVGSSSPSMLQRRAFKRPSTSMVRELHHSYQDMGLLRMPSAPSIFGTSPNGPRSPLMNFTAMSPLVPTMGTPYALPPSAFGPNMCGTMSMGDLCGSLPYSMGARPEAAASVDFASLAYVTPEQHKSPVVVRRYMLHK